MKYEAEAKAILDLMDEHGDISQNSVAAYLEAFAKERDERIKHLEELLKAPWTSESRRRLDEALSRCAALEAERDAFKRQSECRYCGGHHFNVALCSKCAFGPHQIMARAETAESRLKAVEAELAGKDALEKAYQHALMLLDNNTNMGHPFDPDCGECYFCGKGKPVKDEDGEDWDFENDCDHLDKPEAHKDDCAWKMARDFLNKMGYVAAPSSKPCEEKPKDDGIIRFLVERPIGQDGIWDADGDWHPAAKENGK